MASIVDGPPGVSIGRVFSQAFAAIGSNPGTFFGLTFLFGGLPSVVISYLESARGLNIAVAAAQGGGVAGRVGIQIISGVIALFFTMIVQGALVRATVAHAEGRRATFGESAAVGARAAVPLLGLVLLLSIGVGAASIFLLIPGIILYVMWSVAAPALVEERRGVIDSFGRSRALTKGARWRIFGLELVILVIVMLISAVYGVLLVATVGVNGLQNVAATTNTGLPIGWLVGQVILSTILTVFWSATQNSLYVELRRWKDGFTPGRLAEIFT